MKNRLKIAVWHNLPSGGGKRQIYNHINGLINQGHHVESWCPDSADQSFLSLNKLIKEHIVPLKFPELFDKRSIYEVVKSYNTLQILTEAMDEHNEECARQIKNGGFDVLFANACMFFRTTSIGKYVDIPSLIYLGEPYRWFYEAMPELAWLPNHKKKLQDNDEKINSIRLQAFNELEYAKAFDLLLTNSIYSRETILRVYNLESKVCYLGIDTDFYKPTNYNKQNFAVGLGTIYHAKGVDRAIRALGTIAPEIRPNLIWIGNGAWQEDLNRYKALARELCVNFSVKINIPDDEVKLLLSQAKLMLYTSRLEPFGLAPLEANACGTPVVGIAEGGAKETIVDGINGYLVNDDSPELIGKKITKLIHPDKNLSNIGRICRDHIINNWNLEKCTSNIEIYLYSIKKITDKNPSLYRKNKSPFVVETEIDSIRSKPPQNKFDERWKFWLKRLLPPILIEFYTWTQSFKNVQFFKKR